MHGQPIVVGFLLALMALSVTGCHVCEGRQRRALECTGSRESNWLVLIIDGQEVVPEDIAISVYGACEKPFEGTLAELEAPSPVFEPEVECLELEVVASQEALQRNLPEPECRPPDLRFKFRILRAREGDVIAATDTGALSLTYAMIDVMHPTATGCMPDGWVYDFVDGEVRVLGTYPDTLEIAADVLVQARAFGQPGTPPVGPFRVQVRYRCSPEWVLHESC